MWLLDVNVPVQIMRVLEASGIEVNRSDRLGWTTKTNGELVSLAAKNGFDCLVTRDRLFNKSAAKNLKENPDFCIVLLTISQAKADEYVKTFEHEWKRSPIKIKPGSVVLWPHKK